MKRNLKNTARGLLALTFAASFAVFAAHGQTRDLRVVKAVAGGVNFVSGDVKLQTPGQSGWQTLSTKDDLKSGDVVRSGADGRVEVLLNPGSYLRLGVNSEFELTDASLDKLRLKLYKGSAVIEATGYDDMPLMIAVETPQTPLMIVRRGIYRINITPANATEIAVQKGRALVGKEPATIVKSGKIALVGQGGGVEVAKLDKKSLDTLDLWSKERGKELAKLSEKLNGRTARTLLANSDFGRFSGRFGLAGSPGVWVYNPAYGCYTFVSYYGGYWSSPYGGSYGGLWTAPSCYSCNTNGQWDNSPIVNTPSIKSNPPVVYSTPDPVSNPIPVSRGSSGDGALPVSNGKSKP